MVRKQGARETQREGAGGGGGQHQVEGSHSAPGTCVTCISHSVWLTGQMSLWPTSLD